jgi:cell division protein ZapA
MDQPQGVPVSIYGQVYHLRSGSDRAYLEEVAHFVDSKMHSIADRTRTADSYRVAVLAALHIADELYRLRGEHQRLQHDLEARTSRCAALLDEALTAEPGPTASLPQSSGSPA